MKKITNLIIIDASSSMDSKTSEIIGGLKSLFSDIRNDMSENKDVKTKTIICQFASAGQFKVLLNSSKIKKITDEIAENYKPSGMTALYDGIGNGFALVDKKQDGVFVSILTDGGENDSKEFSSEMIKKLFKKANKKKWGLTFMGTTQSAIDNAVSLGVSSSNTFAFADNAVGVGVSNAIRSKSREMYYTSVVNAVSMDDIQTQNLTQVSEEENS